LFRRSPSILAVQVQYCSRMKSGICNIAIIFGNVSTAKLLIGNVASITNRNSKAWTALREAADLRQSEMLRLLIQKGAEVDGVAEAPPLYLTASNGHSDCVAELIAAEAKLNAATQFGYQAIHVTAREVHTDCVPLHLDASVDVDEPAGIEKYTPLHEDLLWG